MYYMGGSHTSLPAPYELNNMALLGNPSSGSSGQYLAKGGKASKGHKGMTKVHMNRHETNILDHLQGGAEHGPGGIKGYSHLEELLKNPHIVRNVHHHAQRHHHAEGGIERLREGGRFGDNEIALIGPNTERLFNELAGHPTNNPNTGHPEYWSIGPALSGLGGALGSGMSKFGGMLGNFGRTAATGMGNAARAAAPVLQQAATGAKNVLGSDQFKNVASGVLNATQPLIQQQLDKHLGQDWGGVAGNIGQTAQNQYLGQGDPNSAWNQLGQAAGTSINKYSQGSTPQQAAGYGMSQFGQDMGGNMGQVAQGFGNAMSQGQGNYQMPSRQDMYNSFNGQNSRNAVQDIGNNLIQGGWGGGQQAARNQMNQGMQRAMQGNTMSGQGSQQSSRNQYMQPQYMQSFARPSNMNSPNQGYGMQNRYDPYNQNYNPMEEDNYGYG